MANLTIKTEIYAADSIITLHRGGATNWRMRASGGNYFLEYQTNNAGEWNVSMRVNELSQGNNIIVTGSITAASFIGNASSATTASYLGRNGNLSYPMTFHWSGQDGQPSWLWGSNDGTDIYVYNPSNFSVAHATSAGNADTVDNLHATSFLQCVGGQTLTGIIYLSTSGAINASDSRTILSFDNSACTNAETGTCVGANGYPTTIRGSELYHSYNTTQKAIILTAANYNSYAPTKTGGGASGTWGINITGNAATSTQANQLTLYAGTANVARYVFFQDSEMYTDKAKVCYSDSFKYNPGNGYLYVPALSYGTSQVSGHLYLIGANASSSTSNTSQIVFGTSSNNHVCISSNNNCLIINPSINSTSGQIALYTDRQSNFPSGIDTGAISASSLSATNINGTTIKASSQLIGTLFLDNNGSYTAYGTLEPEGNMTGIEGRVYFKI